MRDLRPLGLAGLLVAACGTSATTTVTYLCQPACPAGTHCAADGCQPDGEVDVGSGGVDLALEPCGGACGGATPYCKDGACVPCLMDSHCGPGEQCVSVGATTACEAGCTTDDSCVRLAAGLRCCGGRCVDPQSDVGNCGGCAMPCAPPHANGQCQAGRCATGACAPAWGDCNGLPDDGCEANLGVDPAHCGACGVACRLANATAGCAFGCYIEVCNFGWDDCDGAAGNGCETSVLGDVKNCGACGNVCPPLPHGSTACDRANCTLASCSPGFDDCDGVTADGCEVNLLTDARNCGACGQSCGVGQSCKGGVCICPMCSFPHAQAICGKNACIMGACADGWGDCNGLSVDGCEVNLHGSDAKNCGACNAACGGMNPFCQGGTCGSAAASCNDYLKALPRSPSGVYTLDDDGAGPDQPYSAYCEMQADGGGWTLVLKTDGTQQTFVYDQPIWTNQVLLNANAPDLDHTEAKLQSFNSTPFTQMRVGMDDGGVTGWLVLDAKGDSVYSLVAADNFVSTNVGRAAWKTLVMSPSLQPNCNQEGVDNFPGQYSHVRIGILGNNENDCGTPDSYIGLGARGNDGANWVSCGNFAEVGADNGDRSTATFGYLMIR